MADNAPVGVRRWSQQQARDARELRLLAMLCNAAVTFPELNDAGRMSVAYQYEQDPRRQMVRALQMAARTSSGILTGAGWAPARPQSPAP